MKQAIVFLLGVTVGKLTSSALEISQPCQKPALLNRQVSLCFSVWMWQPRLPAPHQPGGGGEGGPAVQLAMAGKGINTLINK